MTKLSQLIISLGTFLTLFDASIAHQNVSANLLQRGFLFGGKQPPDDCPPCFNCNLDAFKCAQFGDCNKSNGKCSCPVGFGSEDCSQPLCGSLGMGKDRPLRDGKDCDCAEGWGGLNCNVCKTNDACNALMPEGKDGVCFSEAIVVKENHQMCDVTNRKIVDQLGDKPPQITFSCHKSDKTCNFQFWIGKVEAFYCDLQNCTSQFHPDFNTNTTVYDCDNIQCACIPGRELCGANGFIDIGDFLSGEIKGPARLTAVQNTPGHGQNDTRFEEPAMNNLIKTIFGDEYITLDCFAGECLYRTDVPGYARPIKTINTPLIAGAISGTAIFLVLIILVVWYLSRRSFNYSPLGLSNDSDEDVAQLMANHKPSSLHFENISYRLNGKDILSDVHGVAPAGQLTAIMGASGAGKSTFLDILARKNKRGTVGGAAWINGEKVADDDYRAIIGFVDQEDSMLPTLTVHETITTSALLRLPRDMHISAKLQRVHEVEKQLGIVHIKDQLIGSEEGNGRGISGGEKRRVGIACELVNSPSILFLDEPTSGLDAYNAFNVVECLVNLAKTWNRTVVFTIHQPRSNIVTMFDQLILLAKGRTVYSGSVNECQEYFDGVGYQCPAGFNIADYLVDLTMHVGSPPSIEEVLETPPSEPYKNGIATGSSSMRAIKSIASTSNFSTDDHSTNEANDPLLRPAGKRRLSLKQQQDRHLYTRRRSIGIDTPPTPKTDDEFVVERRGSRRDSQEVIRLSRQRKEAPPQDLDELHIQPSTMQDRSPLDELVASYKNSSIFAGVRETIQAAIDDASRANSNVPSTNGNTEAPPVATFQHYRRISYLQQFLILSQRTWRNLHRNPMLLLTHYATAILLAVFAGILFYGMTDDIKGFQNRLGLFFFVLALFGFSTLTSLTVFSSERVIFVRERANGYYSPLTYFAAKVIFDIVPLRLLPPLLMGAIVYPMSGLTPEWPIFGKFILILVLFNLAAAAICLCIGIVFRDPGVANLIGSLVMLFSLLFAGLLLNRDAIPKSLVWLQTLSIFHYGFEALIVNEVRYLTLIDHKYGLDIEVPGASILSAFGFNNTGFWPDVIGLAVFAASFVVLAYAAMHFLLVEKR